MGPYLTFEEYQAYGGTLLIADFVIAEFKARKTIDYWTDSRVAYMETVPDEVKYCIMALIKLETKFGAEAQLDNPVVTSFNTDGYSESYGSATDQEAAVSKAVSKAIRQWLYGVNDDEGTPLLYRGVYS